MSTATTLCSSAQPEPEPEGRRDYISALPLELRVQILSHSGSDSGSLNSGDGGGEAVALLRLSRTCRWMARAARVAIRSVRLDSGALASRCERSAAQALDEADAGAAAGAFDEGLHAKALRLQAAAEDMPWMEALSVWRVLDGSPHIEHIDLGFGGSFGDAAEIADHNLMAAGVEEDGLQPTEGSCSLGGSSSSAAAAALGGGFGCCERARLHTLRACEAGMGAPDCSRLACRALQLPALTVLELSQNRIGCHGVAALRAGGVLQRLRRLGLADTALALQQDARPGHGCLGALPECVTLDLSGNDVSEAWLVSAVQWSSG
jgi:hypothetical protein